MEIMTLRMRCGTDGDAHCTALGRAARVRALGRRVSRPARPARAVALSRESRSRCVRSPAGDRKLTVTGSRAVMC